MNELIARWEARAARWRKSQTTRALYAGSECDRCISELKAELAKHKPPDTGDVPKCCEN